MNDITDATTDENSVNPALVAGVAVAALLLTRPLRRELRMRRKIRLARLQNEMHFIETTATET